MGDKVGGWESWDRDVDRRRSRVGSQRRSSEAHNITSASLKILSIQKRGRSVYVDASSTRDLVI